MSGKACLQLTSMGNKCYFFCGDKYALVGKAIPGKVDDYLITGPKTTTDCWPSLKKAGFSQVDACLPTGPESAYMFSGNQYCHIGKIIPGALDDCIITGPHNITDYWPSLKEAGFNKIDAVHSMGEGEVMVFSGAHYCRIARVVPGTKDDVLVNGPKSIEEHWPSMKHCGWKTVDFIFSIGHDSLFAFYGNKYAHIENVCPGSEHDRVAKGYPKPTYEGWPSLKAAKFYE